MLCVCVLCGVCVCVCVAAAVLATVAAVVSQPLGLYQGDNITAAAEAV